MDIYINGKFLCQKTSGVQRYAREVTKGIDRLYESWGNLNFKLIAPKEEFDSSFTLEHIPVIFLDGGPSYKFEQLTLPKYLKKREGYLLNLANLAPIKLKGRNIFTLHDTAFYTHPEFFSKKFVMAYKFITQRTLPKSKLVFTVSNFSKTEILKHFKVQEGNIYVVPNAVLPSFGKSNDPIKQEFKDLAKDNFYFFVGSWSKNKNMAYVCALAKKNNDRKFIISGDKAKAFAELDIEIPDNVYFLGRLNDAELAFFYSKCSAFIFPSMYEGFGIPPIEAIHCGCRCIIASNIPTLKEILEDNANYIEPLDYENLISLDNLKVMSESEAKRIMEKYSWDKSASNVITSISKAIS